MPGYSAHDLVSDDGWDEWSDLPDELIEDTEEEGSVAEPEPEIS